MNRRIFKLIMLGVFVFGIMLSPASSYGAEQDVNNQLLQNKDPDLVALPFEEFIEFWKERESWMDQRNDTENNLGFCGGEKDIAEKNSDDSDSNGDKVKN